ncbi:MAG: amine acid transporter, permease protein region, His/Glu/Gln/Arg/opine family [Hyphomicrobiales bacterium]|nr:amine acid transporter, permease protein region, His/Glu/Gln/Arg/opine family [Hyphomicrobiales bacterium]
MSDASQVQPPRTPFLRAETLRAAAWQALMLALIGWLAWSAFDNAVENMRARGVPTDFSFWNRPSGFDINQTLVQYSSSGSTYGRAFVVGLLNTLLVAAFGVLFATVLGFAIGVARLSGNWIVARLATIYVEVIRNTPLLLQLLFWYNAVLKPLPGPRQSLALPAGAWVNNRGLFLPEPMFGPGAEWALAALGAGIAGTIALRLWSARRRAATGVGAPVLWPSLALVIGLPLLVFALAGAPLTWSFPELRGFNFQGGVRVFPEFVALLLGLSLYTAAFIAEIVRAGIVSVSRGQTEAASALGLTRGLSLRLVVVPQAMRVIVPPLTNQYLNLTKNSSLAVFIGYPDLVQVFAGTVLNQTGAAVQVISITMAVYLALSLLTSAAMNLFNRRFALQER